MGGGQRMNWVKDPNSHFSKLDMGGRGEGRGVWTSVAWEEDDAKPTF